MSTKTKTAAQMEASRLRVLGWIRDAERAKHEDEARAEVDRRYAAVLATYSPRRQWTTRHGATFVEGIGFTSYGGAA